MKAQIDQYIDYKGTYTSRAVFEYARILKRFEEIVKKDITEIGPQDISKFTKELKKARLSGNSVAFNLVIVRNFFEFYQKQGWKILNPNFIKVDRNFVVKSHNAIKPEELERMNKIVGDDNYIDLQKKVAINLLWDTGVRVSELCDLNVVQLDLDNCRANIKTKKVGDSRYIFWSPETNNLLSKYMTLRNSIDSSPYLFTGNAPHSRGRRITTRSIQRWIAESCKKAKITRKISPHSFRHGWGHDKRDKGAPLAFIQKGLGHRNPISTFVYMKYHDKDFEKTAKKYLKKRG